MNQIIEDLISKTRITNADLGHQFKNAIIVYSARDEYSYSRAKEINSIVGNTCRYCNMGQFDETVYDMIASNNRGHEFGQLSVYILVLDAPCSGSFKVSAEDYYHIKRTCEANNLSAVVDGFYWCKDINIQEVNEAEFDIRYKFVIDDGRTFSHVIAATMVMLENNKMNGVYEITDSIPHGTTFHLISYVYNQKLSSDCHIVKSVARKKLEADTATIQNTTENFEKKIDRLVEEYKRSILRERLIRLSEFPMKADGISKIQKDSPLFGSRDYSYNDMVMALYDIDFNSFKELIKNAVQSAVDAYFGDILKGIENEVSPEVCVEKICSVVTQDSSTPLWYISDAQYFEAFCREKINETETTLKSISSSLEALGRNRVILDKNTKSIEGIQIALGRDEINRFEEEYLKYKIWYYFLELKDRYSYKINDTTRNYQRFLDICDDYILEDSNSARDIIQLVNDKYAANKLMLLNSPNRDILQYSHVKMLMNGENLRRIGAVQFEWLPVEVQTLNDDSVIMLRIMYYAKP